MKIRFHLDESVNNAIANGLRLRGLDVTTSNEVGLVVGQRHFGFIHRRK